METTRGKVKWCGIYFRNGVILLLTRIILPIDIKVGTYLLRAKWFNNEPLPIANQSNWLIYNLKTDIYSTFYSVMLRSCSFFVIEGLEVVVVNELVLLIRSV